MIQSFCFAVLLCSLTFAQISVRLDSLLSVWKQAGSVSTEETEEQIIAAMYTAPFDSALSMSRTLLEQTPGLKNNSLYIKTLIHSYRLHTFQDQINMLNEASRLASREGNKYLLSASYLFKAIVYRDRAQTDSAMINALKSKDLLEELAPKYEIAPVLQLIADLHFYAGQYEQAEQIYRRLYEAGTYAPDAWQYITLNNNIGLIRVKQNRFSEAEEIFLKSLHSLETRKMNTADSNALPYLYRKLFEVTLAQKKYEIAQSYYVQGEMLSLHFKQTSELPGIYAAKGKLCLEQAKFDSALYFLKKAEALEKQSPDYGIKMAVFSGFAETYKLMNDTKNANVYLLKLIDVKNTADSVFNRARYMNIFAEHHFNNYRKEIEEYKQRQFFYLLITVISVLSLLTIGVLFINANRKNKKLVQKNIEAVEGQKHQEVHLPVNEAGEQTQQIETDDSRGEQIIAAFEKLMSEEKLYLDKDISVGKISELLGTNRTYLSNAVNRTYNVNFATYINNLRIKEAVHLISTGELKHLSIEGIAERCGFSNRISFNNAFRKFTGVTPSFFVKNAGK